MSTISYYDGCGFAVVRDIHDNPSIVPMTVEEARQRGWDQEQQEQEHRRNRHVTVTPLVYPMWPRLFCVWLVFCLSFPLG